MKSIFAALVILAIATVAHAQTVTVPQASTYAVAVAWTGPASCTTTAPCTYAVYRVPGTTTITAGTTGATLVGTTASQIVAFTDNTVTAGQTYSYAVETVYEGANSGPSNTVTVTIPLVPSAPTGLTGSVT